MFEAEGEEEEETEETSEEEGSSRIPLPDSWLDLILILLSLVQGIEK